MCSHHCAYNTSDDHPVVEILRNLATKACVKQSTKKSMDLSSFE